MTKLTKDVKSKGHVDEITLVRHGETPYNIKPREDGYLLEAGGSPDQGVELTANGIRQATNAGKFLVQFSPFDTYFDSGYKRSIDTLDLILKAFPETESNPDKRRSHLDLREREPGYLFNMHVSEIRQFFPWYEKYKNTFGKFYSTPPGGESIAHVCSRVHMFLNSLRHARETRNRRRVLVASHGRVMLGFRFWLEKIPASKPEILFSEGDVKNCEILRYIWNHNEDGYDKFQYVWNDKLQTYESTQYKWNRQLRSVRPIRTNR